MFRLPVRQARTPKNGLRVKNEKYMKISNFYLLSGSKKNHKFNYQRAPACIRYKAD